MKPLDASDFRAKRFMLEKDDFALAGTDYPGPTDLIDEETWKSIIVLPDCVTIRTTDKYGSQLETNVGILGNVDSSSWRRSSPQHRSETVTNRDSSVQCHRRVSGGDLRRVSRLLQNGILLPA